MPPAPPCRQTRALRRYPAPEIHVAIDGASFGTASSVVVPNADRVGFHSTVAEAADPSDGRLDVLAISLDSKLAIVGLGLSMFTASLDRARGVRRGRGARIHLRSEGDVPFQADGEPVGRLPVDVRVEPGALRLLLT